MKRLASGIVAAVAVVAMLGAGPGHDELPEPGTPGCRGQTIAFIAQQGKHIDMQRLRGLGQLAKFVEIGVMDLQTAADNWCSQ